MAIKATIPANQNTVSVDGLYQWDYGQVLEIECAELGSEIMEVHFACRDMEEAIVRPCTFANGVGTVTIPDRCLEQANNITAWVYRINSTQGHTVKVITLSVVGRTRPSKSQDVPTDYVNQYAEALTEINEAINAIENGTVTAAVATRAISADSAAAATSAVSATYATSAGNATTATTAEKANTIKPSHVATCSISKGFGVLPDLVKHSRIYFVIFQEGVSKVSCGVLWYNEGIGNVFLSSLGEYTFNLVMGGEGRDITLSANDKDGDTIEGTLGFYEISGGMGV